MVRFFIENLEIFFPYSLVYPEQFQYMKYLKNTLDAKGHCVLEMPTGTGKTVALLSLITSYQLANPEIGKLTYCTRTVPEMEKTLNELKVIIQYQHEELRKSQLKQINNNSNSEQGSQQDAWKEKIAKHQKFLGMGMASRRNLCIHPDIIKEAFREKVDERCQALTASWVRAKRSMVPRMASFSLKTSTEKSMDPTSPSGSSVQSDPKLLMHDEEKNNLNCFDIEDGACNAACSKEDVRSTEAVETAASSSRKHCCPYYENFDSIWSPDLLEPGTYTIDEYKKLGESWRHPQSNKITPVCPYFSSRRAIQKANVVVLSYQYILDPRVSQVSTQSLKIRCFFFNQY
jgi:DNA excision repair protein ERCC-2